MGMMFSSLRNIMKGLFGRGPRPPPSQDEHLLPDDLHSQSQDSRFHTSFASSPNITASQRNHVLTSIIVERPSDDNFGLQRPLLPTQPERTATTGTRSSFKFPRNSRPFQKPQMQASFQHYLYSLPKFSIHFCLLVAFLLTFLHVLLIFFYLQAALDPTAEAESPRISAHSSPIRLPTPSLLPWLPLQPTLLATQAPATVTIAPSPPAHETEDTQPLLPPIHHPDNLLSDPLAHPIDSHNSSGSESPPPSPTVRQSPNPIEPPAPLRLASAPLAEPAKPNPLQLLIIEHMESVFLTGDEIRVRFLRKQTRLLQQHPNATSALRGRVISYCSPGDGTEMNYSLRLITEACLRRQWLFLRLKGIKDLVNANDRNLISDRNPFIISSQTDKDRAEIMRFVENNADILIHARRDLQGRREEEARRQLEAERASFARAMQMEQGSHHAGQVLRADVPAFEPMGASALPVPQRPTSHPIPIDGAGVEAPPAAAAGAALFPPVPQFREQAALQQQLKDMAIRAYGQLPIALPPGCPPYGYRPASGYSPCPPPFPPPPTMVPTGAAAAASTHPEYDSNATLPSAKARPGIPQPCPIPSMAYNPSVATAEYLKEGFGDPNFYPNFKHGNPPTEQAAHQSNHVEAATKAHDPPASALNQSLQAAAAEPQRSAPMKILLPPPFILKQQTKHMSRSPNVAWSPSLSSYYMDLSPNQELADLCVDNLRQVFITRPDMKRVYMHAENLLKMKEIDCITIAESPDSSPGLRFSPCLEITNLKPTVNVAAISQVFATYGQLAGDPVYLEKENKAKVTFRRPMDARKSLLALNGIKMGQLSGPATLSVSYLPCKRYVRLEGLTDDPSEDIIRSTFDIFGKIRCIKTFADRRCAVLEFTNTNAAALAVAKTHGAPMEGITWEGTSLRAVFQDDPPQRSTPGPNDLSALTGALVRVLFDTTYSLYFIENTEIRYGELLLQLEGIPVLVPAKKISSGNPFAVSLPGDWSSTPTEVLDLQNRLDKSQGWRPTRGDLGMTASILHGLGSWAVSEEAKGEEGALHYMREGEPVPPQQYTTATDELVAILHDEAKKRDLAMRIHGSAEKCKREESHTIAKRQRRLIFAIGGQGLRKSLSPEQRTAAHLADPIATAQPYLNTWGDCDFFLSRPTPREESERTPDHAGSNRKYGEYLATSFPTSHP